ncbi:50S ribosomal protein L23 [Candidatus Peregrinibacteria bacterium]|nr:50S ribosomal protein L23 [Candidatus Peregrinibacteria bacterium]
MKNISPIIRPLVTEKSSNMQGNKQYSFAVRKETTKIDMKRSIKELYGEDVKEVRMMIIPSKKRLMGKGKILTKRALTKKAIVTLKDKKKTIDPFNPKAIRRTA